MATASRAANPLLEAWAKIQKWWANAFPKPEATNPDPNTFRVTNAPSAYELVDDAPQGKRAAPSPELQNAEVVARTIPQRLLAAWYVVTACVGGTLLCHSLDSFNDAFVYYENQAGVEQLAEVTPIQLGEMKAQREHVMSEAKAKLSMLVGLCVGVACLMAVHSDLLNAYPAQAKRLANCAAESTVCRFLYSTGVGCLSIVGVVVAVLLLAGSVGVYALSSQSEKTCLFATDTLVPAISWVPELEPGGADMAAPHTVEELGIRAEEALEHTDLALLCDTSKGVRGSAFLAGVLCAQASSAGTLFEDIFEPEAAGLAAQLSNRSQQLAWQAVHGREGPPVALLVNDARAVCYELSMLTLAVDDVCTFKPRPPTLHDAPEVRQLRLRRALSNFAAAVLSLLDDSPGLTDELGALVHEMGEALLGSVSALVGPLQRVLEAVAALKQQLEEGGLATIVCDLVIDLEHVWLVGLLGALLLLVAMAGCRLTASADVWHFYTLLPLGPLLAGVPVLAKACTLLAAVGLTLMFVAGLLADHTVKRGLEVLRPVLSAMLSSQNLLQTPVTVRGAVERYSATRALLQAPVTVLFTEFEFGLLAPLLGLGLAYAAWRRGATVLARRAAFPTAPFSSPGAWAMHKLGTGGRGLLMNLLGLLAIVVALVSFVLLYGTSVAFSASASGCRALQASEATGQVSYQVHRYAAQADAYVTEAEPLLETARVLAQGWVDHEPLVAVYDAAHARHALLNASYATLCGAVESAAGLAAHGGVSCADAMPPLALALYLAALMGVLPMPEAPPTSAASFGAASAPHTGFSFSGRAAEYSGAIEQYYRTLGPLCEDVEEGWGQLRAVCAAPLRQRPPLKEHFVESVMLVLSDVDLALAPLLAPAYHGGLLHDVAQLVLSVSARQLHATILEIDALDVEPVLETLCSSAEALHALWALCAAAGALILLVCCAAWYAVGRYTLFLDLVDHHAFRRANPQWEWPDGRGAISMVRIAWQEFVSGAQAGVAKLQDAKAHLPQFKAPALRERVPGEPSEASKEKALL